jgi:predicted dehydrogenase
MASPLKVGVVGVAGIAGSHMPGWAASEHAEVVAGADLAEAALQPWADRHALKNVKLTTSIDEVINDPDIDIIDV